MEAHLKDDAFPMFVKRVIRQGEDTRGEYWQKYLMQLAGKAVEIKFKLTDPGKFMKFPDHNGDISTGDVVKRFEAMQTSFYSLSQYALNLCRDNEKNNDFSLLKTYTGYYASNILSAMEDNQNREVLEKMGYKVRDNCENDDEFVLHQRGKHVEYLAFELFLCQVYYQAMKQECEKAVNLKYEPKIIISMLTKYKLEDILGFGVQKLCEEIRQEEMRNRQEEMRNAAPKPSETANAYECLDPYARSGNTVGQQGGQLGSHNAIQPEGQQGIIHQSKYTRLVNESVEDDDLYGDGDEGSAGGSQLSHSPSSFTTPSSYVSHSPQPTVEPVIDNNWLATQKLPGESRTQSVGIVDGNRISTSDSYAQRAASGIQGMQRQSSLTDKRQATALERTEDRASIGFTDKPHDIGISASSVQHRPNKSPTMTIDDEPLSSRTSLKERNNNIDSGRVGSLKRSQVGLHSATSDYDTYIHLDVAAKQPVSQSKQDTKPSEYENVVRHDTVSGNRSQPNPNIAKVPNLYSTSRPFSEK